MPYCSPHGFVALWIGRRKTQYVELAERETGRIPDLLARKKNSTFCKLGEAGQSLVRMSLSLLTNPCAAALCVETGKYNRFGLACEPSDDKKRQLCELHNVVSTCRHDAFRNSDA